MPDGEGPWPGVLVFPDASDCETAVADNAPYDPALAERHWEALRGFYADRLR